MILCLLSVCTSWSVSRMNLTDQAQLFNLQYRRQTLFPLLFETVINPGYFWPPPNADWHEVHVFHTKHLKTGSGKTGRHVNTTLKKHLWPVSHTSHAETFPLQFSAASPESGSGPPHVSRTWGASRAFILGHRPLVSLQGGGSMTEWGFGCMADWSEWGGGFMLTTHHLLPTVCRQTKTFRKTQTLWLHTIREDPPTTTATGDHWGPARPSLCTKSTTPGTLKAEGRDENGEYLLWHAFFPFWTQTLREK